MKTSNKIFFSGLGLMVLSTMAGLIFVRANLIPRENIKPFGEIVVQKRAVESFSEILISGPFHLELSKTSEGLSVEGDKAYVEKMEVTQSGKQISIRANIHEDQKDRNIIQLKLGYEQLSLIKANKRAYVFSEDVITADEITFDANGTSNIELSINAREIKAEVDGAAKTILKGQIEDLEVHVNGASYFGSDQADVANIRIGASGAANAKVNASSSLSMEASGAANIVYSGEAKINKRNTSGAARIRKKN